MFIHSDYEINKNGKIRHNITKKILKQTESNGYVTVSINGETMYFHRLIYKGLTVQIIIRTFELSDKMMMSVTDERYIKNIAVLKLRTGATKFKGASGCHAFSIIAIIPHRDIVPIS